MDVTPATNQLATRIPGASDLIQWFGYWPTFHDAEVVEIELSRSAHSRIVVHAFETARDVNAKGQYVCRKHVIVSFVLSSIQEANFNCFNRQNVLVGLDLSSVEGGYQLTLEGCYGVDGIIKAESIRIELVPDIPNDSQYLTEGQP